MDFEGKNLDLVYICKDSFIKDDTITEKALIFKLKTSHLLF